MKPAVLLPVFCGVALAVAGAAAAPAGAGSTTTITSASCSLADSTVTFSWSGKTPFAYRVEWVSARGPALDVDYVDKPNKSDTVTYDAKPGGGDFVLEPPQGAVKVILLGKPHGNQPPFFGQPGVPELDQIFVLCT